MSTHAANAGSRWDTRYYLRVLRAIGAAEFKLKYADSILGYAWSILKPLAWFAVLFVVFGRFFKLEAGFEHYGVYLLVGIVTWTFFLDSTMLSLYAFVTRGDVLRKLSFPRIVLPVAVVTTTGLTLLANSTVVALFGAFDRIEPHWTWLLVPLPLLEIVAFTIALCVILATIHVRLRDMRQIWELFGQLLFFASPIIYPVGFLPDWVQKIVFVNPFVQALQDLRALLIPQEQSLTIVDVYGTHWGYLAPFAFFALVAVGGALFYRREAPFLAERT